MRSYSKYLSLVVLAVFSCGRPPAPVRVAPAGTASDAAHEGGLRPGDAVRVDILEDSAMSGTFMVAPNGQVVLPLVGHELVAGKAPATVEAELLKAYGKYLETPTVKVTALRRIAILGAVRQPNVYMVDATVSLTDALAMAGGILPDGNPNDIRLIRGGKVLVRSLDAAEAVDATPIQSGDQIEVGTRGWLSRNLGVVLGTVGTLTVAIIYHLYR